MNLQMYTVDVQHELIILPDQHHPSHDVASRSQAAQRAHTHFIHTQTCRACLH